MTGTTIIMKQMWAIQQGLLQARFACFGGGAGATTPGTAALLIAAGAARTTRSSIWAFACVPQVVEKSQSSPRKRQANEQIFRFHTLSAWPPARPRGEACWQCVKTWKKSIWCIQQMGEALLILVFEPWLHWRRWRRWFKVFFHLLHLLQCIHGSKKEWTILLTIQIGRVET